MVFKHSSVTEAYAALGLDHGASLEVVKSTYKQLALKTHPDKNPDDADATAQFQKLSEAYSVLLKHLDRSSAPPRERTFHPYGYEEADYDDEDDYYENDDDFYYEDDEDEYEMDFYRFLFEELMRGRASRFAHAHFHHNHPGHNHHRYNAAPPESDEQYTERLRRAREEQEQAAERRASEEARRKAYQEREREQERYQAEQRQRVKASAKKAEAEASRKTAEQQIRTKQQQQQTLRSQIFAAARRKDAGVVKKGIWEDNVDAAGGEIRKGAEVFVKEPPVDPRETLLHIAAKNNDLNLVQWLDSHGAEPDERNRDDMTAFHLALQGGYPKIVAHFLETYPPKDEDYAPIYRAPHSGSNLRLALDTEEPEMVWLLLENNIYIKEELDHGWEVVTSNDFKSKISISSQSKHTEFVNLFKSYGNYSLSTKSVTQAESPPTIHPAPEPTRPPRSNGPQQNGKNHVGRRPRPTVTVDDQRSHSASPISALSENIPLSASSPSTSNPRGGHRQRFHRESYQLHQAGTSPSSPVTLQDSQQQQQWQNRGRGRGRGRGQYRGRGKGQPVVGSAAA